MKHDDFPTGDVTDYDTARGELRTGDLMFCSGTSWTSTLIQRATNSCWSHVALIVRLEEIDRVIVLESVESVGVRAFPLSKYVKGGYKPGKPYPGGIVIARHDDIPGRLGQGLIGIFGQSAVDLFGHAYDHVEIARIAVRIAVYRNSDKGFTAGLKQDDEYICSEYVYKCLSGLKIHIDIGERDFITPADFAADEKVRFKYLLKSRD